MFLIHVHTCAGAVGHGAVGAVGRGGRGGPGAVGTVPLQMKTGIKNRTRNAEPLKAGRAGKNRYCDRVRTRHSFAGKHPNDALLARPFLQLRYLAGKRKQLCLYRG